MVIDSVSSGFRSEPAALPLRDNEAAERVPDNETQEFKSPVQKPPLASGQGLAIDLTA